MTRLALVLLLFSVGVPASAQTDLVERILAATSAGATGLYVNPMMGPLSGLTGTAISDSVRARFQADLRQDALRGSLAFLESPAARRVTARLMNRPDPLRIAALAYGPGFGMPAPKKGSLADSTLAARYLVATRREELTLAFLRRILLAAIAVAPEVVAEEALPGETVAQTMDRTIADAAASLGPVLLATARLQFAGVPTVDIEEAIVAEQTAAVRYVRETVAEGTARAVAPVVAAMALADVADVETETAPKPR